MNFLDILMTSPQYFYKESRGTGWENLFFDIKVKVCFVTVRHVFLLCDAGSLYVQCCARFLLVKCQLTASAQNEDKSRRENGN